MTRRTHISIAATAPFDFARTLYSHGWVSLAPNVWDPNRETVERVHRLSSGEVVLLAMARDESERAGKPADGAERVGKPADGVSVTVHHEGALPAAAREEITRAVSRMFRLDEDLSEFYALCTERGGPWAGVADGLGRLFRSPTLFEDVVKTILTTNVQWGGTQRMVRELVQAFGDPLPASQGPADRPQRAFPTPKAVAAVSSEAFAEAVELGYRAPYVHELARRVTSCDLELEALATSDFPTPELENELRAIKGVGPYAAATLLMLIGRYDVLAVDTVFREFVSRRYFGGDRVSDAELEAVYEPWGRWKYLAYWFDLWQGLKEEL